MSEQNLLKMFQGILSSQSFELLSEFSNETLWSTLKQEEKEALAQLFLIYGEKTINASSFKGDLSKAKAAFDSACRLMPKSAKTWFRYGSYLALSENKEDLDDAIRALETSISLDNRFFDAHYALASIQLRLGSYRNDEDLLLRADKSFSYALSLIEKEETYSLPIEFYWHWGIIHFLFGRLGGEPGDFQKALLLYQKAYDGGLCKSDFMNDFANALVEFSLLVGKNEYVERAALLYEEALQRDCEEEKAQRDQAIRLFNAGCCYVHLFESTFEKVYFQKAECFFLQALVLEPLEILFQKMGQLYFFAARGYLQDDYVKKAISCFQKAHALGIENPTMLAYYAEALLMLYDSTRHFPLLQEAESLAELALEREAKENLCSSEPSLAYALCQFEKGNYFNEFFYFESAQELLQKTVAIYPRSAHAWYALALVTSHLALQERDEEEMREAILCFLLASRSVISMYPHFWNSWGLSLLTLGDLTEDSAVVEDACVKFEIAIELSNSSETDWIFNLGCALDLLGYLREEEELHEYALELFKHVEKEDPTLYEVILQQAVVYRHLGDMRDSMEEYGRSLECLNKYLREEEEDEFAWAELGLVLLYKAQKEMRESENIFSTSLSQAEDAFHRALYFGNHGAYYHLACLYTYVKNFPEAMECLWKAEETESLPPLNDLLEEDMLMPLFSTRAFTQFLHEIVSCLEFSESVEEEIL